MRAALLLLCVGCASVPPAPPECPEPVRVRTSTQAAPRGLTAKEAAYWRLAVEWSGEAMIEAAAGDAAKADARRLRGELAIAKAETEARYTAWSVFLFVVGAVAVGAVGGAVATAAAR